MKGKEEASERILNEIEASQGRNQKVSGDK